jgi:hypothetical protein
MTLESARGRGHPALMARRGQFPRAATCRSGGRAIRKAEADA